MDTEYTGKVFEKILQGVFKGYGLSMNFGSTVSSYLPWLKDTGKPAATFQDSIRCGSIGEAALNIRSGDAGTFHAKRQCLLIINEY